MTKCQVTLTLTFAVTPPEKRMASENDSYRSSSSSFTSLNSRSSSNSVYNFSNSLCPQDIDEVYDTAHSLIDLEK